MPLILRHYWKLFRDGLLLRVLALLILILLLTGVWPWSWITFVMLAAYWGLITVALIYYAYWFYTDPGYRRYIERTLNEDE